MKGSGLDVLVGAAFGHITGIMNGKAWVMSMRAFRMVTVALLQHLLEAAAEVPDALVPRAQSFEALSGQPIEALRPTAALLGRCTEGAVEQAAKLEHGVAVRASALSS